MSDMSNLEKKNKELRTALKSDKNSDYIKNITAERDAYKEAVKGADEYIEKHKEVIGDKNVKKYNTAKSRANQIETDIENDITAQEDTFNYHIANQIVTTNCYTLGPSQ